MPIVKTSQITGNQFEQSLSKKFGQENLNYCLKFFLTKPKVENLKSKIWEAHFINMSFKKSKRINDNL